MNEHKQTGRRAIYFRAFAVWMMVITAEIAHGVLRAVLLVPWLGEFRSNQIGVFIGSAIILAIAYASIRWINASRHFEVFVVGAMWLLLTVAFELLFGRLVMDLPWHRLLADYNLFDGGLMPLGLVVLLLSPWMAAVLRSHQANSGRGKRSDTGASEA